MSSSSRNVSLSRSTSIRRTTNGSSPRFNYNQEAPNRDIHTSDHRASRGFYLLIILGPLVTFILAIYCGYFYVFPSHNRQAFLGYSVSEANGSWKYCNVSDGRWVWDESYPLYNSSECPFVEQGFNCLANGREDADYLKWRWQPGKCSISRFKSTALLEKLRGQRISFVGDSMSRTQWESMVCLLMNGVEDKSSVYEVSGNQISKTIRYLGVRFSSFNITVEFFRSVFLVRPGLAPRHAPKRVKSTLKLDKLDDISHKWVHTDVLIFNTGHWWVPSKLFEAGCYFQIGGSLKLGLPIREAFRRALQTWASWVENSVDTNRTHVFFRTFEPSHWSDKSRSQCTVTQYPMSELEGSYQSGFTDDIMEVVANMTARVTILRITLLSAYRSDAHVGPWNLLQTVDDCSHWCLPGVPDVWNEIVLMHLFSDSDTEGEEDVHYHGGRGHLS